jgi:hypothetical protein
MRDQPSLIGRIPREPAAQMVIDAALADMIQRHFDRFAVDGVSGPQRGAENEGERRTIWKFGRGSDAAVVEVEPRDQLARDLVQHGQ